MVLNLCGRFCLNVGILEIIIFNIKNFDIIMKAMRSPFFSGIFLDRIQDIQILNIAALD
jgi:hypothetical protein